MFQIFLLLILELISIVVYLDLYLVNNFQRHIFDPLLKMISEKQRKVYQGAYRLTLNRKLFCVSDKIDVSGTTFNNVLLWVYIFSLFSNIIYPFQKHHHFLIWINGLVWLTYMMYCIVAYRDVRELCFYCKFSIVAGAIHFV